jgi:two-component system, NarL family, response regulator NreC
MMARAGNGRPAGADDSPGHGRHPATVALAVPGLLIAEVLARVLRDSGLHVVGHYATLDALLERLRRCRPAIAIVDGEMRRPPGDLLAELRAAGPHSRLVVVAGAVDGALARAVIEHEASAVILKSSPMMDAVEVLQQVVRGQTSFPAAVLARLGDRDDSGRLSTRQFEVLEQLAQGHSNDEIARRLFISVNTVKFHLRIIYDRLGVNTRVEAAQLLAGQRA